MSDRLFVATRKGLFAVERSKRAKKPTWKIAGVSFLGDPVSIVLPDRRDGSVLAALDLGHFGVKIHRSRDGTGNWSEVAAPQYPPEPPGDGERDSFGRKLEWKLRKVWALAAGSADEPGVIWCGTIPGGLFRSPDSGASWAMVRPLWDHPDRKLWFGGGADWAGIHSICVDPRDSRHVTVGVSCGGVWVTPDGGANWKCQADGMWASYMPPEKKDDPRIQDPHQVVQCRAKPDCLWAQHHNGIFRTTDGAAWWRELKEVPPSVFGFAVAVHPEEPDTAWFVPATKDDKRVPVDGKVVVARTRDGGKSFDVLRKGLPQAHAYDITYRHGLDVDETGTRLAFGSTTGSLWISEDQGDSWTELSSNLPPVYCVRFG
ncbi:MAG: exo-alpha-sialidase [Planctomycetales bacterium]|nr:exo-alpha-sialidase [Planctomycetales bacterium]